MTCKSARLYEYYHMMSSSMSEFEAMCGHHQTKLNVLVLDKMYVIKAINYSSKKVTKDYCLKASSLCSWSIHRKTTRTRNVVIRFWYYFWLIPILAQFYLSQMKSIFAKDMSLFSCSITKQWGKRPWLPQDFLLIDSYRPNALLNALWI